MGKPGRSLFEVMMQAMKHLPLSERPRERLVRFGSEALSSIELLAILLGSGTKSRPVLTLAADLLSHFGSLQALAEASLTELQEVKGIGLARAIQLHAAFALLERKEAALPPLLDTPERVYEAIRPEMERQKAEALLILLRDVKRRLIHREIVAKGTLTQLVVHPREIYHLAIKHRAHSLILAHNHPSGDPSPSYQDREMTQVLHATGKVVGISLADHLIIGRGCYLSFYEKGWVFKKNDPY